MQAEIPAELYSWLITTDSLTARIKRACACNGFQVRVLKQEYQYIDLPTAQALQLKPGLRALLREVELQCHGQAWIYARSIIPVTSFSGRLQRLKYQGSRSLGATLFTDRSMRRGKLQITRQAADLWGRRSVFYLQNKPLLVAEYFLPALWQAPTASKTEHTDS